MKNIIIAIALLAAPIAQAGVNCYTDSFGNTYCSGTGVDSGYQSNNYGDSFGNSYGSDNQGNTWNCYSDSFGNTYCN